MRVWVEVPQSPSCRQSQDAHRTAFRAGAGVDHGSWLHQTPRHGNALVDRGPLRSSVLRVLPCERQTRPGPARGAERLSALLMRHRISARCHTLGIGPSGSGLGVRVGFLWSSTGCSGSRASDDDEEAIVLGVRCPTSGGCGLMVSAYGSGAPEVASIVGRVDWPTTGGWR